MSCPSTIGAFYYPWYGGAPNYRHWSNANGDERFQRRPPASISAKSYPVIGPYDSLQPATVDRHLEWARQAGIDVLISSWWGPAGYEDRGFDLLLRRMSATARGMRGTIYFETPGVFAKPLGADVAADPKAFQPHSRDQFLERTADWLSYVVKSYGSRPEFVQATKNGRRVPVVFLYATQLFKPDEWRHIFARVRTKTGVDPFYQGNVGADDFENEGQVFDGVHVYEPMNITSGTSALLGNVNTAAGIMHLASAGAGAYAMWASNAHALGRSWAATVMPGFDDGDIRAPSVTVPRDRGSERTYDFLWREALASSPEWVLIMTFNEWHEDTQIEPSVQYGNEFITRTRRWADRVHGCTVSRLAFAR